MKQKNISTFIYSVIICFIVAFIVAYPGEAFSASADGLMLWFNVVFPSLLPFFICVEILIGLGIIRLIGSAFKPVMKPVFNVPGEGSFGFFMSIASGYPVGAKITARLRQDETCTVHEAQRLLSLCSTSGPLFIVGAVATGILKSPSAGFLLAVSHYFSAITVGFLMRFYYKESRERAKKSCFNPIHDMLDYREKDGRSIGVLLGDAVNNGISLILMIGGFIIFFSVITRILRISGLLDFLSRILCSIFPFAGITRETMSAILIGVLEVTNGTKECAALQIPFLSKMVIVSFMMGFGGLSVNAQVLSIIAKTDLKFGIYMAVKLLQGVMASIYSYTAFKLLWNIEVFNLHGAISIDLLDSAGWRQWIGVFCNSSAYLLMSLIFIFLMYFSAKGKRLKHNPF
ncbi:MAG: sporulation integral membrane protein YlbJ [Caulobacteraceae bacterium]